MMLHYINKVAERTQQRMEKEGGNLKDILADELMKEAQKKSHKANLAVKQCDQSKNIFETIIAPGEDIDNN